MQEYSVAVKHPTNYHSGTYVLTVRESVGRPKGTRYVSGAEFGCSRDYLTKTDEEAIRNFMAEHGYRVVSALKRQGRF